jgi:hypothetical protein
MWYRFCMHISSFGSQVLPQCSGSLLWNIQTDLSFSSGIFYIPQWWFLAFAYSLYNYTLSKKSRFSLPLGLPQLHLLLQPPTFSVNSSFPDTLNVFPPAAHTHY